MSDNEQLDGMVDLNFSIVCRDDELLSDPKYRSVVETAAEKQFLLVEDVGLLFPFTDDFDLATLEDAVNSWLARPALVTRGVVLSAREVIKKLKKLGFREKSAEGSHVHFISDERKGKVTVPIHGGEIPKGTLKSILNQAGVDMNTFAMA